MLMLPVDSVSMWIVLVHKTVAVCESGDQQQCKVVLAESMLPPLFAPMSARSIL
jgi:hypothetical protein